jgi:hypothetical protein
VVRRHARDDEVRDAIRAQVRLEAGADERTVDVLLKDRLAGDWQRFGLEGISGSIGAEW